MKPLLRCVDLRKSFGGVQALKSVSLEVGPQQIVSVIGPNGAGKTTLFNCLSGIYRADDGQIFIDDQEVSQLPSFRLTRRGVARTFQNIRLFSEMNAYENIRVAQFIHSMYQPFSVLFRTRSYLNSERSMREEVRELLDFVGLSPQARTLARHLSYGLQRRLEIARALATRPKVLLLDEPAAGMNPQEVEMMIQLIQKIKAGGLSIVLIEHHMKLVMELADYILVMNHGEPLAGGSPTEIKNHPEVIAAYLGREVS